MTSASTSTPILEARGLSRSFGAVRALGGAAFEVHRGEVVAVLGPNGAISPSTPARSCSRATRWS